MLYNNSVLFPRRREEISQPQTRIGDPQKIHNCGIIGDIEQPTLVITKTKSALVHWEIKRPQEEDNN